MSRRTRPYLPGAVFHLTARTHRKERWFDEAMRDEIVRLLADAAARTDAKVLAYAVMPNHLHLVVRHGRDPLHVLLQQLLRRVALRVQRAQDFEGHVFGARFRERTCADPEYVRNAIVYTHLNPVRAGLCEDPATYRWSSHVAFCTPNVARTTSWLHADDALRLFALASHARIADCARNYERYLRWRVDIDRATRPDGRRTTATQSLEVPLNTGGDAHWLRDFRVDVESASTFRRPRPRPDLRDIAQNVLVRLATTCDLDLLRGPYGGRPLSLARRAICRAAAAEGYRNRQIAEFLRLSESRVSRLAAGVRRSY